MAALVDVSVCIRCWRNATDLWPEDDTRCWAASTLGASWRQVACSCFWSLCLCQCYLDPRQQHLDGHGDEHHAHETFDGDESLTPQEASQAAREYNDDAE